MVPDRCYAGVYEATIEDCKEHGALDPKTMVCTKRGFDGAKS